MRDKECPYRTYLSFDNNSSDTCIEFLTALINNNDLIPGDILIMDNAPIHTSKFTLFINIRISDVAVEMLQAYGINIYFQPAYSPEFNACEFLFNYIKNYLKSFNTEDIYLEYYRGLSLMLI